MKLGELSVWQIARQQGISPRHARRLFARFKNDRQPRLGKSGRLPQPFFTSEVRLVKQFYKEQPMGATCMERILSICGKHVVHQHSSRELPAARTQRVPETHERTRHTTYQGLRQAFANQRQNEEMVSNSLLPRTTLQVTAQSSDILQRTQTAHEP